MSRPDGSPAARDRPATERAIVDAAARLLSDQGFSALNVQAVAELAGVDRKLVYRYFGGVEGVVERLGAEVRWTLGDAAGAGTADTYGAAITGLARAYGQALSANPLLRGLAAWDMAQDTPLLRTLDAARSAAMMVWMRERVGALPRPEGVDAPAINAVLVAAIQMLALRHGQGRAFAGIALDDAGWARIEGAVATLAEAVYGA